MAIEAPYTREVWLNLGRDVDGDGSRNNPFNTITSVQSGDVVNVRTGVRKNIAGGALQFTNRSNVLFRRDGGGTPAIYENYLTNEWTWSDQGSNVWQTTGEPGQLNAIPWLRFGTLTSLYDSLESAGALDDFGLWVYGAGQQRLRSADAPTWEGAWHYDEGTDTLQIYSEGNPNTVYDTIYHSVKPCIRVTDCVNVDFGDAFRFENASQGVRFDSAGSDGTYDLTFGACEFYNIGQGIVVFSSTADRWNELTVVGATASVIDAQFVRLGSGSASYIQNSAVRNCTADLTSLSQSLSCINTGNLETTVGNENHIENNVLSRAGYGIDFETDGSLIYTDQASQNVIVRWNYGRDSKHFMHINSGKGPLTYHHNYSYDCDVGMWMGDSTSNNQIFYKIQNNTFHRCDPNGHGSNNRSYQAVITLNKTTPVGPGVQITNNVVDVVGDGVGINLRNSSGTVSETNNIVNATDPKTDAAGAPLALGSGSSNEDPQIYGEGNPTPLPGSPCIGAATAITGITDGDDYFGREWTASATDIGCANSKRGVTLVGVNNQVRRFAGGK